MKKVILGVCGSIAAYKSALITRLLIEQGHQVRVIMTHSATEFISPLTLQTLSQQSVRVELFDSEMEAEIDHISLARWADVILIAPASANSLAKFANGMADDMLSTVCLASTAPIYLAPAMNQAMWAHPATQQNVAKLQNLGYHLISPDSGYQACGEIGAGRLPEPDCLVDIILNGLKDCDNKPLQGIKICITAGPTIERIDPVRYISNDSSGKMGYALANSATQLGAIVTLISGPTVLPKPIGVHFIATTSAKEMANAVEKVIAKQDWFIATAAVSDYAVANQQSEKIKKQANQPELTLKLIENPDILQSVCARKNKPFSIGFAAETENVLEYAKQKLNKKGADLICANDVSDKTLGFNSDNNAVTVVGDKLERAFPAMPKTELAKQLLLFFKEHYENTFHQNIKS